MNLLLGEILKYISSTLRNEELNPTKENLRVSQKDDVFTIEIRRRFLWVFYVWVDLCYLDDSTETPIHFNSLIKAIDFIKEITK